MSETSGKLPRQTKAGSMSAKDYLPRKGGNMRAETGDVGGVLTVENADHPGITKRPTESRAATFLDKVSTVFSKTKRSVHMAEDGGKIYTINGNVVTKEEYDAVGQ